MTHAIADAEAAIARNPESLQELSKAADLLIEQGDPRGEDFAACLAGDMTAEQLMRQHPACRYAMFVAAWAMLAPVRRCRDRGWKDCDACETMESQVEALRLLAECGKVGVVKEDDVIADTGGYFPPTPTRYKAGSVATRWYEGMRKLAGPNYDTFDERLALLDAYAMADPETRRKWADETRALTPIKFEPITLSAADSAFLATLDSLARTARADIIRGLAVPADVLRGGAYINTREGTA